MNRLHRGVLRRGHGGLRAGLLGALTVLCCATLPAMALAATAPTKAPEVGYLAASHVSTTGATIEVQINPEGGETSYEIFLECQNAQENNQTCEPLTVGSQREQGVLSPGLEQQIVTDAVTGLRSGYLYKYDVIATNSAGRAGSVGDGFLTCPSEGFCPSQPYLSGVPLWVIEGVESAGAEAPKLEAEREAKAKEEAERPLKEAAARADREHEIREAGERAGREAAARELLAKEQAAKQASAAVCLVPSLKGDSLAVAQSALRRAHCKLGKVSKPRTHHGALIVIGQSAGWDKKLANGAAVAVRLGEKAKHG